MIQGKNSTTHRQITVQVGPWREDIDEQIAPLIREMWIAGIATWMSCQEDGWGKVWLEFDELSAMTQFLNIVAHFEPGIDALYNRMNLQMWPQNQDLLWDYELHPFDSSLVDADEESELQHARFEGSPDFYFTYALRFPPCDLPTVYARMQQYNFEQQIRLKV